MTARVFAIAFLLSRVTRDTGRYESLSASGLHLNVGSLLHLHIVTGMERVCGMITAAFSILMQPQSYLPVVGRT